MYCKRCNKEIPLGRQTYNAVFCSKYCRQQYKHEQYIETIGERPANRIQRGAASELLVAADLLTRGYDVYRALNSDSKADLIVVKENNTFRIQVRTVQTNANGQIAQNKHNKVDIHCDILALVVNQTILYFPEKTL